MKLLKVFSLVCLFFFLIGCEEGATRFVPADETDDGSSEVIDDSDVTDPTNPTDDPTNPTDDPTNPTDDPTNPTDDPTNPPDDPTNPTDDSTNPTDDTDDPTDNTDTVPNPDDDNNVPLTDEEKCVAAGGEWDAFADNYAKICYKIENCTLPEGENADYIVWRDAQSYTLYYDFENDTWTGETYTSEYSDTGDPKICQYICASNAERDEEAGLCKPYCSAVFNGSSSKIEVENNDLLALNHFWTIEAWIKQDFNNLTTDDEVPIVRKGDGYYLSGFYKTTQGYNPMQQKTYYNMEGSFEYTYSSYGRERTDDFTVTSQYEEAAEDLPIETGGWNHVALSYYIKSGTAHLRLYINGKLAKETTKQTNDYAPNTVSEALTIGYYLEKGMQIMPGDSSTIGDEEYFFKGKIDQLKIKEHYYEEEFTPSQLSVDDNTIAFWDFSNNANDSSANGLNGTGTNVIYSTDCAF